MTIVVDLREIERLYDQLLEQALFGGNNGRLNAAAPIPGGAATVALGPWSFGLNSGADKAVNDLVAEQYRKEHYADKWREDSHPLLTLATWSMVWREWFGHDDPVLRVTVRSASTYLRLNAAAMRAEQSTLREHPDGTVEMPPDLAEMVSDIAAVRATLENIVSDGQREERSQVPCLDCGGVRLVRRYTQHVANDHWLCPKCKRRYSPEAFIRAKHQHLSSQGADRYVPMLHAIQAVTASAGVARAWIAAGKVKMERDPGTGRLFVWWPDLRSLDREHTMRTARRHAAVG